MSTIKKLWMFEAARIIEPTTKLPMIRMTHRNSAPLQLFNDKSFFDLDVTGEVGKKLKIDTQVKLNLFLEMVGLHFPFPMNPLIAYEVLGLRSFPTYEYPEYRDDARLWWESRFFKKTFAEDYASLIRCVPEIRAMWSPQNRSAYAHSALRTWAASQKKLIAFYNETPLLPLRVELAIRELQQIAASFMPEQKKTSEKKRMSDPLDLNQGEKAVKKSRKKSKVNIDQGDLFKVG